MQDKNQGPKTQVKIMQERNQRGSDQSNADGKRRRNGLKRRNVLAKKIGAIFSSACGSRKRVEEMYFHSGVEEKECTEGKERPISEEDRLALNKAHLLEEIQVDKVHASGRRKVNGSNCKKRSPKLRPTVSSSFFGIFRDMTAGFNMRKRRAIKTGCANGNGAKSSGLKPSYGRIIRATVRLKRGIRWAEKKTWWDEEKPREAEEVKSELELCKKRILMGEKCRPLNLSGVLHYDKEGILLPEDVLPIEES